MLCKFFFLKTLNTKSEIRIKYIHKIRICGKWGKEGEIGEEKQKQKGSLKLGIDYKWRIKNKSIRKFRINERNIER